MAGKEDSPRSDDDAVADRNKVTEESLESVLTPEVAVTEVAAVCGRSSMGSQYTRRRLTREDTGRARLGSEERLCRE